MIWRFLLRCCLLTALLLVPLSTVCPPVPEKHFHVQDKTHPGVLNYESQLRHWADSIGWDWRLIAAIVYHESRFNYAARSGKGAVGLMQINSPRYTEEALLNPSFNLSVGTAYLKKLSRMYEADSAQDSLKFALAAYNFGERKIKRLKRSALEKGLEPGSWDSVSQQLPAGHHTVAYVQQVLDRYASYRRLYPL